MAWFPPSSLFPTLQSLPLLPRHVRVIGCHPPRLSPQTLSSFAGRTGILTQGGGPRIKSQTEPQGCSRVLVLSASCWQERPPAEEPNPNSRQRECSPPANPLTSACLLPHAWGAGSPQYSCSVRWLPCRAPYSASSEQLWGHGVPHPQRCAETLCLKGGGCYMALQGEQLQGNVGAFCLEGECSAASLTYTSLL